MAILRVDGVEKQLEVANFTSLLDAVMNNDIPIATACGGVAACGLCRITVRAGGALLTEANAKEIAHLGSATVAAGLRLACQARLVADGEVQIEIPPLAPSPSRKQEKYTRMIRERRAERAQARAAAPSQGRRSGGRGQGGQAPPQEGGGDRKSNPPPRPLEEEGSSRSGRRRRRRRKR